MHPKIGHREAGYCSGCGNYHGRNDRYSCKVCSRQTVTVGKFWTIVEMIREYYLDGSRESNQDLAVRMGRNISYLAHLKTRPMDGAIKFSSVDETLCRAELSHLWQSDPELRETWWEGDVPPDASKPMRCIECNEWSEVPDDIDEFRCGWCRSDPRREDDSR